MRRLEIPAGTRYGRLTVIAEAEKRDGKRRFLCRCNCGALKAISLYCLRSGDTRSCGCWSADLLRRRNTIHGHAARTADGERPRLYGIWRHMKARCSNPRSSGFDLYGGRGITVCPEWLAFEPFYEWAMANGYRDDLTIDRADNDGGYEPGNCRWVDRKTQQRNMRTNHRVSYQGVERPLAEWGEVLGIARSTLDKRLRLGWSAEKALTTPVGGRPAVDIRAIAAAGAPVSCHEEYSAAGAPGPATRGS